jgi:hypothetical protein
MHKQNPARITQDSQQSSQWRFSRSCHMELTLARVFFRPCRSYLSSLRENNREERIMLSDLRNGICGCL